MTMQIVSRTDKQHKTIRHAIPNQTDTRTSRRKLTDAIDVLCRWAELNGSRGFKFYYVSISKLIKGITGIEKRIHATPQQIAFLEVLESATRGEILKGVEKQTHYKQIYKNIKQKLTCIQKLMRDADSDI